MQKRIENFRNEFGITVAAFCRRAGISTTTYYCLMAGKPLSDATLERVNSYLAKYGF